MTDTQLSDAYERTDFWVDDVPVPPSPSAAASAVSGFDRPLMDHDLHDWVFVTACNPGSQQLCDKDNDCRTRALECSYRVDPV